MSHLTHFLAKLKVEQNGAQVDFASVIAARNKVQQWLNVSLPQPLAAHCMVADLTPGILQIVVDSGVWHTELRYRIPNLLSHLRNHYQWYGLRNIQVKTRLSEPTALSADNHQQRLCDAMAPFQAPSAPIALLLRETAHQIVYSRLQEVLQRLASRFEDRGT